MSQTEPLIDIQNEIAGIIRQPLPQNRISTADIAVGMLSSTDVSTIAFKIAKAVQVHQDKAVREARIEMAEMYTAIGRDDLTWGSDGVPEEVLKVFPRFRASTADIPRGKKNFMGFVLEELANNTEGEA